MSNTPITSQPSADNSATTTPTPNPPIEIKRRRFDKPSGNRHAGVSYSKEIPETSLNIVPITKCFPVFVSNCGAIDVCAAVYNTMQGKDFRISNSFTVEQLQYVTTVAFCNRVVQTAYAYGYAFPHDASRLKQVASGIQLPSILCSYIESIGAVELLNGATVVPFSGDYRQLFPRNTNVMVDPGVILERANRPARGHWSLDTAWIVAYNNATTRASRMGMRFRPVDNSTFIGRKEMVVSYEVEADYNLIKPLSPQVLSEAEAQLGALYRFRNYTNREDWLGANHQLLHATHVGVSFDPEILCTDLGVAVFRGPAADKEL